MNFAKKCPYNDGILIWGLKQADLLAKKLFAIEKVV